MVDTLLAILFEHPSLSIAHNLITEILLTLINRYALFSCAYRTNPSPDTSLRLYLLRVHHLRDKILTNFATVNQVCVC